MDQPVVPKRVQQAVSRITKALPDVAERETAVGTNYMVRNRIFLHLFAIADPSGKSVTMLAMRADPDERVALIAMGHPFFAVRSGAERIGVILGTDTDWDEIAELVTESYCQLAPQKLVAQVRQPPLP